MKRCPCCGREDSLEAVLSVIDFKTRDICATCFDNNAEPQAVVLCAENTGLLASVTVFHNGSYMTAADWLASAEDDEPEIDPRDEIDIRAMRSILDKMERGPLMPPRRPLGFGNLWGLI